jgi:hypothetical protein
VEEAARCAEPDAPVTQEKDNGDDEVEGRPPSEKSTEDPPREF